MLKRKEDEKEKKQELKEFLYMRFGCSNKHFGQSNLWAKKINGEEESCNIKFSSDMKFYKL